MAGQPLPLKALHSFEAAARHESASRAAAELGVTQSAVSHQIRNLEDHLQLPLFHRQGGRLQLTAEGAKLYQDLSEAFSLMARSLEDLHQQQGRGALGITLRPHFALKWLAPRLPDFWRRYPGFDLRFHHSNAVDFTDPAIQIAIEWCHEDRLPEGAQLLVPGDLTPACGPSLLTEPPRDGSCLDPALLDGAVLLHGSDETAWRAWLTLVGCGDLKPVRNEFHEDTNVRQQLAIAGAGFALVCPQLVTDDIAAGRLILPFAARLTSYAYYLVIPRARREERRVRNFANWILAQAGEG
jgi:LysR family glycine cleavage system transcriptional activator